MVDWNIYLFIDNLLLLSVIIVRRCQESILIERFIYSKWDERISDLVLDEESILDAIYDQILENGNIERSLRNLMNNGMRFPDGTDARGLRQMIDQVRKRKEQMIDPYEMEEIRNSLNEKINEILNKELNFINDQKEIYEHEDLFNGGESSNGDANQNQIDQMDQRKQFLENLPETISGKIDDLSKYDFLDEIASKAFDQLLKALQDLQQKILDMFQQKIKENSSLSHSDDSSISGADSSNNFNESGNESGNDK